MSRSWRRSSFDSPVTTRVPQLLVALLTLGWLGGCTDHFDEEPAVSIANNRPNIIFIFTDDHAYQAISAYGGRLQSVAPTPNIDRIAASGMRFDRATVTNSICAPARAVIQTGKHSHLNGVRDNLVNFDNSQQTFPKILREHGYETAMIGKWHLKSEPVGFDFWQVLPDQGHYYNPDFRMPDGLVRERGYVTDLITDKTVDLHARLTLLLQPGDDPS